jgi:two-component system, LytTR family, sensor kinase
MQKFWKYRADHVLFWLITIGFHIYTRIPLISKSNFGQFSVEIILRNALLALVIYANLLLLIPSLLQKRKFIAYGVSLVALLFSYSLLKNAHDVYLASQMPFKNNLSFFSNTFYNFSIALFYLTFSVGLYLSKEWYFQREKLQQIELEKVNTELAYLKNQINPHFLFNSLNTVYFQIDKSNSEARDTLLKFSEMLRFQLYECNGKEIDLEKEISYVQNYVDLQRTRKDENYKIEFSINSDLKNATIAPLLLIPFIENSFKHSSHFTDRMNEVRIQVERNENLFSLKIANTKENQKDKGSSGIGIKNVKRRLELQYPGKHILSVKETDDWYEVQLTIHLNTYET